MKTRKLLILLLTVLCQAVDAKEDLKPIERLVFSAEVRGETKVSVREVSSEVKVKFSYQGSLKERFSLELRRGSLVTEVSGPEVKAWAIRHEGERRFFDVLLSCSQQDRQKEEKRETQFLVKLKLEEEAGRLELSVPGFGPGEAVGFSSQDHITPEKNLGLVAGAVKGAWAMKGSSPEALKYFSTEMATIGLRVLGSEALRLSGLSLRGVVSGGSVIFELQGTVEVKHLRGVKGEETYELPLLEGKVGLLKQEGRVSVDILEGQRARYLQRFDSNGVHPVALTFAAPILSEGDWRKVDVEVLGTGLISLVLEGLEQGTEFNPEEDLVPTWMAGEKIWKTVLPSGGRTAFAWKQRKVATERNLVYTAQQENVIAVTAGQVTQTSKITLKALQGSLSGVHLKKEGTGEILSVRGDTVHTWTEVEGGVQVVFSPSGQTAEFHVESQTRFTTLPAKVEPVRLKAKGAVRDSGELWVFRKGEIQVVPNKPEGLQQMALPRVASDQNDAAPGGQVILHYRLPSAQWSYHLSLSQVQPEVSVSEVFNYQIGHEKRTLRASLQLEVKESGLSQLKVPVPEGYQVLGVTGAEVQDYRLLEKGEMVVLFRKKLMGRHLVSLDFEQTGKWAGEIWEVPSIAVQAVDENGKFRFLRGEIGFSAEPGLRLIPREVQGLAEIPMNQFAGNKATVDLAFRIDRRDWAARFQVEEMEREVQADLFHLYSLREQRAYVSVLANHYVSAAPAERWAFSLPPEAENVAVKGRQVRDFFRKGETLEVPLMRPLLGACQVLVTYEVAAPEGLKLGSLSALEVNGERGYYQIVSPEPVEATEVHGETNLIPLAEEELPAEYRLLARARSLGVWQYNRRPAGGTVSLNWLQAGSTSDLIVEYAGLVSRLSAAGGAVTDVEFSVRMKGGRTLELNVPEGVEVTEVRINGESQTARRDGNGLILRVPAEVEVREPVKVALRLGKQVSGKDLSLTMPRVRGADQLAVQWEILADAGKSVQVLEAGPLAARHTGKGNTMKVDGLTALRAQGSFQVLGILALAGVMMAWLKRVEGFARLAAVVLAAGLLLGVVMFGLGGADQIPADGMKGARVLLAVPVLGETESLAVTVRQVDGRMQLPILTMVLAGAALLTLLVSRLRFLTGPLLMASTLFMSLGFYLFYIVLVALLALAILGALLRTKKVPGGTPSGSVGPGGATITAASLFFGFGGLTAEGASLLEIEEQWTIAAGRVSAEATLSVDGKKGERLRFLGSPAVLKDFEGPGLRLVAESRAYDLVFEEDGVFDASIRFEMGAADLSKGVEVPTEPAAVHQLNVSMEASGWAVWSAAAARVESGAGKTKLWLLPTEKRRISFRPAAVKTEGETREYHVTSQISFVPEAGVLRGRQDVKVRVVSGSLRKMTFTLPDGFTVSEISGKAIGAWWFDQTEGTLDLSFQKAVKTGVNFTVELQRTLSQLPVELTLEPLRAKGAKTAGGLLGLGGSEGIESEVLGTTGLARIAAEDFPVRIKETVIQSAFRFGMKEMQLKVKLAAVQPEVRTTLDHQLSWGGEQMVLQSQIAVQVTRAGVFQLRLSLTGDLKVESLTGAHLERWELLPESEPGVRVILLQLDGQKKGTLNYHLVQEGPPPALPVNNYQIPSVRVIESLRETGQIMVTPGRGIQLEGRESSGVTEAELATPRSFLTRTLAWRILNQDWRVSLSGTQLKSSVEAVVLHQAEIRNGYQALAIELQVKIDQAPLRELILSLPGLDDTAKKSLRASGREVLDLVFMENDQWKLSFRRPVIGAVTVRLEGESRQAGPIYRVHALSIPEARQEEVYLALRSGPQLDLKEVSVTGLQRRAWSRVPDSLKLRGGEMEPLLSYKVLRPQTGEKTESMVTVQGTWHEVLEASRVRVKQAALRSVLSLSGNAATAAEIQLEVMKEGPLGLSLPEGGELLGVLVNDESVVLTRKGGAYEVPIEQNAGTTEAVLKIYYTSKLQEAGLEAMRLGAPLEQITWALFVPQGQGVIIGEGGLPEVDDFSLIGNLASRKLKGSYQDYLEDEKSSNLRSDLERLKQAEDFIESGQNTWAVEALEQVVNRSNLDRASDEDARVQFNKLLSEQAEMALNTRRQRALMERPNEEPQLAVEENPLLQGRQNFRQEDYRKLRMANDAEVNRSVQEIAQTWVARQGNMEKAGRMLAPVLTEKGKVYRFEREIQVDAAERLKLDVQLETTERASGLSNGMILMGLLLVGLGSWKKRAD